MERRSTLLLVDDMASSRALLRGVFEEEYDLLEAEDGQQAMAILDNLGSKVSVVLLDLVMPVKDGVQVLEEMGHKGMLKEIPVVVISGAYHGIQEERLLEMGASDIILKPFNPRVIQNKVRNMLELYRHKQQLQELVKEQAEAMRRSHEHMVDTLSTIIEHRSLETGQHNMRIRYYTKTLLEELAMHYPEYDLDTDRIRVMANAAVLHDMGKIAIPDAILNKPGRLTPEEFEVMKGHAPIGAELTRRLADVSGAEYVRYAYNICRHHHERWDGGGYPDGLKGDNIPICAQAAGLADVYDALTTPRVYKPAVSHERAVNMILNGECGEFSPKLMDCFFHKQQQFKDLARIYADGNSGQEGEVDVSLPPAAAPDEEPGMLALLQGKYHALLNYIGATVMEVDLTSGIFHMVYSSGTEFSSLRTSSAFREAIMRLADEAVHPDDRAQMINQLYRDIDAFCDSGQRRQTKAYRLYSAGAKAYVPHTVTVMRMDAGGLAHRRLLVILHQIRMSMSSGEAAETDDVLALLPNRDMMRRIMGGLQVTRYDKLFTIVHGSGELASLLGYTPKELEDKYQNSMFNMLLSEDREGVVRQIQDQLSRGNEIELAFRMPHKKGHMVWMLEKSMLVTGTDGNEYFYGSIMDINHTRMSWDKMSRERERYRLIVEQSDDVIFEYDVATDSISYSNNWDKLLDLMPKEGDFYKGLAKSTAVHPEDIGALLNLAERMLAGEESHMELELRIAQQEGGYMWCRLRISAQYDKNGSVESLIGSLSNINEMKQALRSFQSMAERDGLTGLTNKETFTRTAQDHLLAIRGGEEDGVAGRAALLILDLDNFKQVNDKLGHHYGDIVLTEFADKIKALFRHEDLVGRIGGDEFAVLMWGAVGRDLVRKRCERAVSDVEAMFGPELKACGLSCSIGVAMFPDNGASYQELFQAADKALYQAKSMGKNCFSFYDPASIAPVGSGERTAVSRRIDSDDMPSMAHKGFVERFFHSMYLSKDLLSTIDAALALLGQQLNVSRAYIFENSDDNLHMSNTFEWCNKGVTSEKDNLQNISYSAIPSGWEHNYDENGVFYCTDASKLPEDQRAYLEPQGIKSMLQCAIRDKGVYRGFIGFDECENNRLWTKDEITLLSSLSEVVSIFLLKKRAQDKARLREQDLMRALDRQNAWIYIIDPDTFELKYINAKTLRLIPGLQPGMKCYRALLQRDSRCPGCPAVDIRERGAASAVIENKSLGLKVLSEATLLGWQEAEACMISCRDIEDLNKLK